MAPISPIRAVVDTIKTPSFEAPLRVNSFGDYLRESIETVESMGQAAKDSADRFLNGEGEEIHQVALAAQRAELSFELMLQVRNKVIQAYQEIMRIQL